MTLLNQRLLQAMGGSIHGGAENFFMRLAPALNPFLPQKIVLRPQADRKEILTRQGIDVVDCSFGGCFDFKSHWIFFQTIRQFCPQLILTWMNRATAFCPNSRAMRALLPPFIHVARLGGYYNLKYYQKCDALIGNTKGIVEYIISTGWARENVFYIPNFVKMPDLKQSIKVEKRAYQTPERAPVILALGRFHVNKGFDTLIRSLVFVKDAYLWLLGEGPEEVFLRRLAQEVGVLSRVRFLGWQENITPFFKTADLFVCSSRHEPLGNVILDAWSHACPVVAAASQGPRELIHHGQTGLLVEIDEPESFAAGIFALLHSPELKIQLVEEAYRKVSQEFSKESVIQRYLTCFETLTSFKKAS